MFCLADETHFTGHKATGVVSPSRHEVTYTKRYYLERKCYVSEDRLIFVDNFSLTGA